MLSIRDITLIVNGSMGDAVYVASRHQEYTRNHCAKKNKGVDNKNTLNN